MKIITAIPVGILITLLAYQSVPAEQPAWKLIWQDEFSKPGAPDPTKWGYEKGFVRNHEKQYYTVDRRENARVENGHLIIEARKEDEKNTLRYKTPYTSASLNTRGKDSWKHCRIEIRAKLPAGRGMWPAIWMLGDSYGKIRWPDCGEIDIMEFVGHKPKTVHANIHCKKYNHIKHNGKGSTTQSNTLTSEFHIYALEWHEDRMDFFFDGKKYFSYKREKDPDAWPYDKNHYLLINLAVGGSWGGAKGIDDTIFPQKYLVDYVRVYKKAK